MLSWLKKLGEPARWTENWRPVARHKCGFVVRDPSLADWAKAAPTHRLCESCGYEDREWTRVIVRPHWAHYSGSPISHVEYWERHDNTERCHSTTLRRIHGHDEDIGQVASPVAKEG